jgi:hypothetical protein
MSTSRTSLFAEYSVAASDTLQRLDVDALAAPVQDVARSLVRAEVQFIPAELKNGVVTIPSDYQEMDAPALLPMMSDDPLQITLSNSALRPAPRRLTTMAQETGLTSPEDRQYISSAFDRFANKGQTRISLPQHNTATTFAKQTTVAVGEQGQTLTYHTRPLIVVRHDMAQLPSNVQGPLLVHEIIHGEDRQRTPALGRVQQLDPIDVTIADATFELRGYHGGAMAAENTQHPALDRQAQVEAVRAYYADPQDPFMPTRAILQYLIVNNILGH